MRGHDFLDKMELVDPAYVEAADKMPEKRRVHWVKWCAMAACLCLITAGAALTLPRMLTTDSPGPDSGTPDNSGNAVVSEQTSDSYQTLAELLAYLSKHDYHDSQNSDAKGVGGVGLMQTEGRDTVSYGGYVYQLGGEYTVNIWHDGVQVGTLPATAQYLFLLDGRLIAVGTEMPVGPGLDPEYRVTASIFDVSAPDHPVLLDRFTQLGSLTACYLTDGLLYLMTSDGVCACGWSRLDDVTGYVPRLWHGDEELSWPEENIRILGSPTGVKYVAVTAIVVETLEVVEQRACYGDINGVFYGGGWFAFATASQTGSAETLPDLYTFDGTSMAFTGKVDTAAAFGLEKTAKLTNGARTAGEYPRIVSVSRYDRLWRVMGEYTVLTAQRDVSTDLFALTYDQTDGAVKTARLSLPEAQLSLDDVLWEEDRAILSAGCTVLTGAYNVESFTRLAFASFDGADLSLRLSDLVCSRVTGVDGMYSYGRPFGYIHPFISLGNGLYLRYNETPNGFDLYDFTDSSDPQCLYRSPDEAAGEYRLDFVNYVYDEHTVGVKMITPVDGRYFGGDVRWLIFSVDPSAQEPFTLLAEYAGDGIDFTAITP